MADLYVVDFSGGEAERARRRAEQDAERARLRSRYVAHLTESADADEPTARRVIAAIFDHFHDDGRPCECSCHPRFSDLHGDGFDCPCSWDEARRVERGRDLQAFWDSRAGRELEEAHRAEEDAIEAWLAAQTGVSAKRTTSYALEQWEGTVDGHSFYFRERHGEWRIELDLRPSGRFANRVVEVHDGELLTAPVELDEGHVIARGVDSQLGNTPVEHVAFIVRTVHDHLRVQRCEHAGAQSFCPSCGTRIGPNLSGDGVAE